MVVDPAEQPFVAPAAEVAERCAFGRQILRDQAPGDAPAQHVEDGIQDLAGGPGSRATARGRLRHERGNHRPLRIRQVCFVTKAGAAMVPPGSRGPHGTSRSGFSTRLKAPPARPINPHSPLSGRALSGHLSGNHHYTGITIRMVGIEEDEDALDLAYASKLNRRPDFLRRLFDLGRDRAPRFYEDG